MTSTLTLQERATIDAVAALGAAIKQLGEVPSGHLYARVMGHLTLEQYTWLIDALKRAHLVEEKNHVLRWVGPK